MKNLIRRTIAAILVFGVMAFVTACGPDNGGGLIGNQDPVAVASHIDGATKYAFGFDGSHSTDSDGDIVAWEWTFGDGGVAAGEIVAHTYSNIGGFTVILTVTDNEGARDSVSILVTIESSVPVARFITSPSVINLADIEGIKDPDYPGLVAFDGRGSTDGDGESDIDMGIWDFGDGCPPISGIWTYGADDEHGITQTFSFMREVTHTYTKLPIRTYNPVTGEPQTLHYTATLTITDYAGHSSTTTRDIIFEEVISNGIPTAVSDTLSVTEDIQASGNVSTNDTASPDGGNIWSLVGVSGGAVHGTVIMGSGGTFTYSPDTNYHGTDTFNYRIHDVDDDWSEASVIVTVSSINDAPVAVVDSYTTDEDTTLTVVSPGVLGNDTDADGDYLTSVVNTGPVHGDLTLNTNGSFTYTPDVNWNGIDTFTYYANDGGLDSNVVVVTITVDPVVDFPVAVDDVNSTGEDVAVGGNVSTNDTTSTAGGDVWSLVGANGGAVSGIVSMDSGGVYTYTPGAGYSGVDSFNYQVCADGGCSFAVVTITVDESNSLPLTVNDTNSTYKNTPVIGDVSTNDTESADGGNVWAYVAGNGEGDQGDVVMNSDGTYTFTPKNNKKDRVDVFTYSLTDIDGDTSTATLTITIGGNAP